MNITNSNNIDFVSYNLKTGQIISKMSCPAYAYGANAKPNVGIGYLRVSVPNCDNFYVLDGKIVERPRLNPKDEILHIRADGIDSISFNNIPPNSTVSLDDKVYEINDGTFKFTTEKQGRYTLKLNAFPFLDDIIMIEAS